MSIVSLKSAHAWLIGLHMFMLVWVYISLYPLLSSETLLKSTLMYTLHIHIESVIDLFAITFTNIDMFS